MKIVKILGTTVLIALIAASFAQSDSLTLDGQMPSNTVTVTLQNEAGSDLTALQKAIDLRQLSTSAYTYSDPFTVRIDYSNVAASSTLSLDIKIDAVDADYDVAYRFLAFSATASAVKTAPVVLGTTATALGSTAASGANAGSVKGDADAGPPQVAFEALTTTTTEFTFFEVGAQAKASASADLTQTTVTLTATVN
ncbi:MAG: hypothetical protein WD314_05675 [Trueperaceae bacterium]